MSVCFKKSEVHGYIKAGPIEVLEVAREYVEPLEDTLK